MAQWWRRLWGGFDRPERLEVQPTAVDDTSGRTGRRPVMILRIRVRGIPD